MRKTAHKAEKGGEKKDKSGRVIKSNLSGTHPILQLQQTIGNRAVTKMIQRHPQSFMNTYMTYVKEPGGEPFWNFAGFRYPHSE